MESTGRKSVINGLGEAIGRGQVMKAELARFGLTSEMVCEFN